LDIVFSFLPTTLHILHNDRVFINTMGKETLGILEEASLSDSCSNLLNGQHLLLSLLNSVSKSQCLYVVDYFGNLSLEAEGCGLDLTGIVVSSGGLYSSQNLHFKSIIANNLRARGQLVGKVLGLDALGHLVQHNASFLNESRDVLANGNGNLDGDAGLSNPVVFNQLDNLSHQLVEIVQILRVQPRWITFAVVARGLRDEQRYVSYKLRSLINPPSIFNTTGTHISQATESIFEFLVSLLGHASQLADHTIKLGLDASKVALGFGVVGVGGCDTSSIDKLDAKLLNLLGQLGDLAGEIRVRVVTNVLLGLTNNFESSKSLLLGSANERIVLIGNLGAEAC
jgi:hypothetical protein